MSSTPVVDSMHTSAAAPEGDEVTAFGGGTPSYRISIANSSNPRTNRVDFVRGDGSGPAAFSDVDLEAGDPVAGTVVDNNDDDDDDDDESESEEETSSSKFPPLQREALTMTFHNVRYRVPVKADKQPRLGATGAAATGTATGTTAAGSNASASTVSAVPETSSANAPRADDQSHVVWKDVLQGVSGAFRPGELVAIMGSSGAGKTTLLNVFAGRVVGFEGDVRFNGRHLKSDKTLRRLVAYVQQDDIHFATLTAKEHLRIHAMLRMDQMIPDEAKLRRVDEVILALGLRKCENTIMGSAEHGKKGISGGEARRVTFATELLTDPSIIFVDEPTSGLDAFMAENVIRTLRALARAGRTVICTIHQPSSDVYSMFDRVMFLAEGRIAYFGDREDAPSYFARVGYPIPPMTNPAEHIIKSLSLLPHDVDGSRARINHILTEYEGSDHSKSNEQCAKETFECRRSPSAMSLSDASEIAADVGDGKAVSQPKLAPNGADSPPHVSSNASWLKQFRVLLWRSYTTMWRDPTFTTIRLVQSIVMALVIGFVFLGIGNNQVSIQDRNGAIFIVLVMSCFSGINEMLQVFPSEVNIFRREYQSSMYSVSSYYISRSGSELPFQIVFPVIFGVITYFMIGFNNEAKRVVLFLVVLFLASNAASSAGLLISGSVSSPSAALALGPSVLVPLLIVGGYFINSDSVPKFLYWLKYMSFFKYGFEAMAINEWSGAVLTCSPQEVADDLCRYTTGEEVLESLNLEVGTIGGCIGILCGLVAFFRIAAYLVLLLRARSSMPKAAKPPKNRKFLQLKRTAKSESEISKDENSTL